jgi:hypothetical protein
VVEGVDVDESVPAVDVVPVLIVDAIAHLSYSSIATAGYRPETHPALGGAPEWSRIRRCPRGATQLRAVFGTKEAF